MSLKVINLGLPKSGTTTLARALKMAGLKVADHRIRPKQTNEKSLHNQYVADLVYSGYFQTGDPGAMLGEFDAITEMSCLRDGKSLWPQMDYGVISALRASYPGAKFLASTRDSWAMSRSMLAWSNLGTARLPDHMIPGLPAGFGGTSKERMQWIEAHYAHISALFQTDANFLELDIANPKARDTLSEFLGCDLPWWGKVNRTPLLKKIEAV